MLARSLIKARGDLLTDMGELAFQDVVDVELICFLEQAVHVVMLLLLL